MLQSTHQEAEGSKCQYKFLTSLIFATGRINYTMATYTHAKQKAEHKQDQEVKRRGVCWGVSVNLSINVLLGLVSLKKYIYTKIYTTSVTMAHVEVQRYYKSLCIRQWWLSTPVLLGMEMSSVSFHGIISYFKTSQKLMVKHRVSLEWHQIQKERKEVWYCRKIFWLFK